MRKLLIAVAFFAFLAAAVQAQEILTYPGAPLGNPYSVFPYEYVPPVPNSLFPHTSWVGNTVTVNSGTVGGHVFGGIAARKADMVIQSATNNTVNILGGTIGSSSGTNGNVTGGWTDFGSVINNRIDITGTTTIYGIVFGGWINGGSGNEAKKNIVNIAGSGVMLRSNVYGAYTQGATEMTDNIVTIDGSSVWKLDAIIAGAYSALNTSTITDNTVTITGGTDIRRAAIYGGRGQGLSTIENNTVTITGGNIGSQGPGSTIYGGHNFNGSKDVTDNTVSISGGNIRATIYGGGSTGGVAEHNAVTIGGTANFLDPSDIYGGYSTRGSAVNNTVTIDGTANLNNSNIFGGFVNSGGGDAFTGNALQLNTPVSINSVRNFETVQFGYSGDAGIGTLYTTPTGSKTATGTTLKLSANLIDFDGDILGTGDLTIDGGTFSLSPGSTIDIGGGLYLTDEGTLSLQTNAITLGTGRAITMDTFTTLQLGNGIDLSAQKIVVDGLTYGFFDVAAGDLAKVGNIDGVNGNMAKTGEGTLVLIGDAVFQNGEITVEGTLQVGDGITAGNIALVDPSKSVFICDNAFLAYDQPDKHTNYTESFRITGQGTVIQRGEGELTLTNLTNDFTGGTEIERGTVIIDRASDGKGSIPLGQTAYGYADGTNKSGYLTFTGADRTGETKNIVVDSGVDFLMNSFRTQSGARTDNYVDFMSPDVEISGIDIADKGGAFYVGADTIMTVNANSLFLADNQANGKKNDLYIEAGTAFNLNIDGYGSTVTFGSGIDGEGLLNIKTDGAGTSAMVILTNERDADIFHVGSTLLIAERGSFLGLNMVRSDPATDSRILFDHFSDNGDSNGFYVYTNKDEYGNEGAAFVMGGGIIRAATEIEMQNGVMLLPDEFDLTDGSRIQSTMTLDAPTVLLNNFHLLYSANADGTQTQKRLTLDKDDVPVSNNTLLNIISDDLTLRNGTIALTTLSGDTFIPGDYLIIRTNNGFKPGFDPNVQLSLVMDEFVVDPASGSPRGTVSFALGGDPDDTTGAYTSGDTNVWLENKLHSLTMQWVSGDINDAWTSDARFTSRQTGADLITKETKFLPGDKVYIGGTYNIALANSVTVSGLVAGRNSDESANAGNVTFTGDGGITADIDSAFGQYVNSVLADQLVPTGKLEKFGNGTLAFQNTGGNLFMEGIDIHDGTIAFSRSDQLQTGAIDPLTGKPKNDMPITFFETGSLQVINDVDDNNVAVELYAPIVVNSLATATFNVDTGNALLLNGTLTGSGGTNANITKRGEGILQVTGTSSGLGLTYVYNGEFRVVEGVTYDTRTFQMADGTLAGGGTIKVSVDMSFSGALSPDSAVFGINAGGSLDRNDIDGSNKYGTLTLDFSDSTSTIPINLGVAVTSNKFTMDFDVDAASDGNDSLKDLLVLKGNGQSVNNATALMLGEINFRGALKAGTNYLIIRGDNIAGYNTIGGVLNQSLTAKLNDVTIGYVSGFSVRGHVEFVYGDTVALEPGVYGRDSDIWLQTSLNSLTMNWQGSDGTWDHAGDFFLGYKFESLQGVGSTKDYNFQPGDEVAFYNATTGAANAITIEVPDTVLASQMWVGRELTWDGVSVGNIDHDGDVTFTGDGAMIVDGNSAFGEYLLIGPGTPKMQNDGALEKHGAGTLVLNNAGPNAFKGQLDTLGDRWGGGTNLYDGTIVIGKNSADPVTGLSQALGFYDRKKYDEQGMSGSVVFNEGLTQKMVQVEDGVKRIQNYFEVWGTNNTFYNEGDLEISGIGSVDGEHQGGAFFVLAVATSDAALTIQSDGHLTLEENWSFYWNGSEFVPIKNDIHLIAYSGNSATLNLEPAAGKGIFIKSGITTGSGSDYQLNIAGDGFVQIAADSDVNGKTNVLSALRIVDGTTYGSGTADQPHTVDVTGTLAGNGTLRGSAIDISGTISPDGDTYLAGTPVPSTPTQKIATLTLERNGFSGASSVTLNGFTFDYDVVSPAQSDLLKIVGFADGEITIGTGTIDFLTDGAPLATGSYLIIEASSMMTRTPGTSLSAKRNGVAFDDTPRGSIDFYFDSSDTELWANVAINSLVMNWQGGAEWNTTDENFLDDFEGKEKRFMDGDFVNFNASAGDVEIAEPNTTVSGLLIAGDVTFKGDGGIIADKTSAFGKYVWDAIDNPTGELVPTGALEIISGVTVRFENTGVNDFREGIDLKNGKIEFDRASQLYTGDDGAITMGGISDGTLAPYASVQLQNEIYIDNDTAIFQVDNADHVLILTGKVHGDGNVKKTGAGILQFSYNSPAGTTGDTTVAEGQFRVVDDVVTKEYSTKNFTLAGGALLAGNGIISATETITINGTISPDRAVFTINDDGTYNGIIDNEQYAVLTLNSGTATTLDGFTFDDDVNGGHDLLAFTGDGDVLLVNGTVDFNGSLSSGRYLIMTSEQSFDIGTAPLDGINDPTNGVLKATHNSGGQLVHSDSPRGNFAFVFDDDVKRNEIWIETEINSLTMGRTADGQWNDAKWQSKQVSDDGVTRWTTFNDGDFTELDTTDSFLLDVNIDVITSGLTVSGDAGNMTLTGDFGIWATTIDGSSEGDTIEGRYLDPSVPAKDRLVPTGKFIKSGTGTFTFANTGGNLFKEGIELHGGTLAFNDADQLQVGDGKAIVFKESATLHPLANVILANTIDITATKTATFDVAASDRLTLTGALTGGNVEKTGGGALQFSGTGDVSVANTTVSGGEFRVVEKAYTNSGDFSVTNAMLSGNGTIIADTIAFNTGSGIRPDNLAGTPASEFGTLTLNSVTETNLDGFTFLYDADGDEHDLLAFTGGGSVLLKGGKVEFQTVPTTGSYWIMSSEQVIGLEAGKSLDGITGDGVLTANIVSGLPRGAFSFVFDDDAKNIYLEAETNSLTMARSTGGDWNDNKWESAQKDDVHDADRFANGDFVRLNATNAFSLNVDRDYITSGLTVDGIGDITLTGAGITAKQDDPLIQGRYLDSATAWGEEVLVPTGTLVKDGAGTLTLLNAFNNFEQGVAVRGGTLAGTATIGGNVAIHDGATLRPGGLSTDKSVAPVENPLTINGNLIFEAGSNYDVRITQYDDGSGLKSYSDKVVVGGAVTIGTNQANLNVDIDYWGAAEFDYEHSGLFTIIEAGTDGNTADRFVLAHRELPRGVTMQQGWNGSDFDLWFDFDPTRGFKNLCVKHNRIEIGTTLDWFTENGDPGIRNLIDRLSDPSFTDAEVCRQLDALHGDLTPNALLAALKEPWRHPFNRLSLDCPVHVTKSFQRQLWGEFTARYENAAYDGNAHGFTVNRYGVTVGVDQQLGRRSVLGATFQYADPRLRQTTGKVEMDDYEFGLYNMTRLADHFDVKLYAGYSHQNYKFDRYVSLPASPSGNFDAFFEHLHGNTKGDALAASVELIRSLSLRNGLRLLPVAALDFEQAWIRGYRESAGETALAYDSASLERLMFRVGFGGEFDLRNRITLNGRIQYATQLNDREYPAIGVRFANGPANQYTADVWGSRIGRDYVNVGLGANWKLSRRGDKFLYVNYDGKWYDRATVHIGEAGFVKHW